MFSNINYLNKSTRNPIRIKGLANLREKTEVEKFQKLGGRPMLEKISKIFYDKVYEHPWIGLYFKEVKQEQIESQQVDFMQGVLGGEKVFCGQLPKRAHQHIMITEDLFELRQELLMAAFKESGASQDLIDAWLKVDDSFKHTLIKNSLDECEKRFATEDILDFPSSTAQTYKKAG